MSLLNKIQTELHAPKNQYNSFGKYKYRSLEDIFEGLKPLLKEHGCSVTVSDDIVLVGDRFYVKATATLFDSDGKEVASNTGFARESDQKKGMDSSQVTGATSSYARKYALNGLFAIDDVKDADSMDNSKDNRPTASKATDQDKKRIWSEFKEICERYGVDAMEFIGSQVDTGDKNAVHNTVNKWLKNPQALTDQLLIYKNAD